MELPADCEPVTAAHRLVAAVAVAALVAGCARGRGTLDAAHAISVGAAARLSAVSEAERKQYLRRARIFEPVDVATRDITTGPADEHAFGFLERVSCNFVEPRRDRVPTGGTTPKFFCTLRHGTGHRRVDLKVKYGGANRETYGEMLGSRLLWALGVAVDHDYAVELRCHGCPAQPWLAYRDFPKPDVSPRETRPIDHAVVQRLYPGAIIESRPDEGWLFSELDLLDEAAGGASPAERDALRLLAAFIAHGDDKAPNQRLVCPLDAIASDGSCTRPRLLIADLGSTFGRGASRVFGLIDKDARPSFANWSTLPMWQDAASCRAYLVARASPSHPQIHEAGRRLLAERLAALSERQIRALFTVARIEDLGETIVGSDGKLRPVTVDDWVRAFERRRAAIVDARCPE